MAPRVRIAVVYGGRSTEHPISVLSAGSVLAALDPAKYEVITLGITRDGGWVRTEVEPRELQITGHTLPEVPAGTELALRSGSTEVAVFDAASAIAVLDGVDLVFPVLHGAYGEDGTIQGLLEMAGVGYVGSGVLASAAAMDKAFAKTMLAAAGLDVGSYRVLRPGDPLDERAVLAELGLPLFVKPARAGSSIGISKVRAVDELPAALKLAFEHDSKVLLEAAVAGREIECGVLQDADGTVSASLPAEIRLHPDYDWYSFEAKYLEDASDFDVPAEVGAETIQAIQDASCRAFRALDCAGLARVDFFLGADGRLVLNEVNTMPGFTAISMYPKMWEASGVSYPELLDRLIATALARRDG